MSLPQALEAAIGNALGRPRNAARVSGGDLNDAWRVEFDDAPPAFVKTASDAQTGTYQAEAAGLRWLGEPRALRLPEVRAVVDPEDDRSTTRLLALDWIDEGQLDPSGEEELGRGLAELHAAGADAFGHAEHNPLRLGPLEIPNEPTESWPEFYAERRLRPLADQAEAKNALPNGCRDAIEKICERLEALAGPEEPPARLHGDLWSGNVLADESGKPHLIDPAAYGGHREIDLAMLRLFGGPSERCHAAYNETKPLAEGHEERVGLWQLFPLLVHAVLFGGGYGSSVQRIASRLT